VPVVESIVISGVRRWGLDYGSMRVWGSIAFIFSTLLGGQLISRWGGADGAAGDDLRLRHDHGHGNLLSAHRSDAAARHAGRPSGCNGQFAYDSRTCWCC
jgi:hypothetical protein